MNDTDFKNTLIKALQLDKTPMADKPTVLSTLLKSNIYIEYTSLFTRREWNTYSAFLHIQVPVENYELMKKVNRNFYRLQLKFSAGRMIIFSQILRLVLLSQNMK